jgi:hypothetical protein
MNKEKLVTILLILVIVFSLVIITLNLVNDDTTKLSAGKNVVINDPDDSSSGEVGLVVLPKEGGAG